MTRWRLIGFAVLTLLLSAGCYSWNGDSSVTLSDGTTLRCGGLRFQSKAAECWSPQTHSWIEIPWKHVAGYRAGAAR